MSPLQIDKPGLSWFTEKEGHEITQPTLAAHRTFNCQFSKQASLEDNLGFLRDMLKELRR